MTAAPTAHVPPQNIEAEESVLGAMLVAEPALTRVIDEVKLNAGDFYLDKHATIFTAVHDLYAASKPVDELSVSEALTQRNQIEEAGGKHYVSELAAKVPAAGNAKHYAEIVQQNADMRRVLQGLHAGAEVFDSRNGHTPREVYARVLDVIEAARPRATVHEPSSWRPYDLTDATSGIGDPAPSILARSDGYCLLYDERIAQAAGEPEACKGWLAMTASAGLLQMDCTVLYVDFESTATEIAQRLLSLGVDRDRILEQFVYVRPHEPLIEENRVDLKAAFDREPALIVIDGVTEALTIHGLDLSDNSDIAHWLELLPRPAARTGAAVLMIDHVVKDKEARGRYAIGGQHKLAGVDVAYKLEVIEPFGRGKDGLVKVKVMKDRAGHVRAFADGDEAALMRLTPIRRLGASRSSLIRRMAPAPMVSFGRRS